MDPKLRFMREIERAASALAPLVDDMGTMARVYSIRGYAPAPDGTDPITNEEAEAAGLFAADISEFVGLCNQLSTFIESRDILDRIRRDL